MRIVVRSQWRGETWEGDVPDALLPPTESGGLNERLFRLFNRVDAADNARLEAWGYRLPSLSVGDVVEYEGEAWRVAIVGFDQVTT